MDKVVHAVEYGGFTVLLASALHVGGGPFVLTRAAALATLYGISDEYHQKFVPGRDAAISDVVADFAGVLLVCTLLACRRRRAAILERGRPVPD